MSIEQEWREVSEEEFYDVIGPQDVTPSPVGRWPYTSLYKSRSGAVQGKAEGYLPEGSALPKQRYWLPKRRTT